MAKAMILNLKVFNNCCSILYFFLFSALNVKKLKKDVNGGPLVATAVGAYVPFLSLCRCRVFTYSFVKIFHSLYLLTMVYTGQSIKAFFL